MSKPTINQINIPSPSPESNYPSSPMSSGLAPSPPTIFEFKIEVMLPCGGTVTLGASDLITQGADTTPRAGNNLHYPEDFQELRPLDVIVGLKRHIEKKALIGVQLSNETALSHKLVQLTPIQYLRLLNNSQGPFYQCLLEQTQILGCRCSSNVVPTSSLSMESQNIIGEEGAFIRNLCKDGDIESKLLCVRVTGASPRHEGESAQDFIDYIVKNRSVVFVDVIDYCALGNNMWTQLYKYHSREQRQKKHLKHHGQATNEPDSGKKASVTAQSSNRNTAASKRSTNNTTGATAGALANITVTDANRTGTASTKLLGVDGPTENFNLRALDSSVVSASQEMSQSGNKGAVAANSTTNKSKALKFEIDSAASETPRAQPGQGSSLDRKRSDGSIRQSFTADDVIEQEMKEALQNATGRYRRLQQRRLKQKHKERKNQIKNAMAFQALAVGKKAKDLTADAKARLQMRSHLPTHELDESQFYAANNNFVRASIFERIQEYHTRQNFAKQVEEKELQEMDKEFEQKLEEQITVAIDSETEAQGDKPTDSQIQTRESSNFALKIMKKISMKKSQSDGSDNLSGPKEGNTNETASKTQSQAKLVVSSQSDNNNSNDADDNEEVSIELHGYPGFFPLELLPIPLLEGNYATEGCGAGEREVRRFFRALHKRELDYWRKKSDKEKGIKSVFTAKGADKLLPPMIIQESDVTGAEKDRRMANRMLTAFYLLQNFTKEELKDVYTARNEDVLHTALDDDWTDLNLLHIFRDEECMLQALLELPYGMFRDETQTAQVAKSMAVTAGKTQTNEDLDDEVTNPILELHPEHDGNILHDAVKRNFLVVVAYLQKNEQKLFEQMLLERDQFGYTPLQYAAECGYLDMCRLLWSPPLNPRVVATVLNLKVPTIVESREAAINQGSSYPFCFHGRTPLHGASFFGNIMIVKDIVEHPLFLAPLSGMPFKAKIDHLQGTAQGGDLLPNASYYWDPSGGVLGFCKKETDSSKQYAPLSQTAVSLGGSKVKAGSYLDINEWHKFELEWEQQDRMYKHKFNKGFFEQNLEKTSKVVDQKLNKLSIATAQGYQYGAGARGFSHNEATQDQPGADTHRQKEGWMPQFHHGFKIRADRLISAKLDLFTSSYMNDSTGKSLLHHTCLGGQDKVAMFFINVVLMKSQVPPPIKLLPPLDGNVNAPEYKQKVAKEMAKQELCTRAVDYIMRVDVEDFSALDYACGILDEIDFPRWYVKGNLQHELKVLQQGVVVSQGTDERGICRSRYAGRELTQLLPSRTGPELVNQIRYLTVNMLDQYRDLLMKQAVVIPLNPERGNFQPPSRKMRILHGDQKNLKLGTLTKKQKQGQKQYGYNITGNLMSAPGAGNSNDADQLSDASNLSSLSTARSDYGGDGGLSNGKSQNFTSLSQTRYKYQEEVDVDSSFAEESQHQKEKKNIKEMSRNMFVLPLGTYNHCDLTGGWKSSSPSAKWWTPNEDFWPTKLSIDLGFQGNFGVALEDCNVLKPDRVRAIEVECAVHHAKYPGLRATSLVSRMVSFHHRGNFQLVQFLVTFLQKCTQQLIEVRKAGGKIVLVSTEGTPEQNASPEHRRLMEFLCRNCENHNVSHGNLIERCITNANTDILSFMMNNVMGARYSPTASLKGVSKSAGGIRQIENDIQFVLHEFADLDNRKRMQTKEHPDLIHLLDNILSHHNCGTLIYTTSNLVMKKNGLPDLDPDDIGESLLHEAIRLGEKKCVKTILKHLLRDLERRMVWVFEKEWGSVTAAREKQDAKAATKSTDENNNNNNNNSTTNIVRVSANSVKPSADGLGAANMSMASNATIAQAPRTQIVSGNSSVTQSITAVESAAKWNTSSTSLANTNGNGNGNNSSDKISITVVNTNNDEEGATVTEEKKNTSSSAEEKKAGPKKKKLRSGEEVIIEDVDIELPDPTKEEREALQKTVARAVHLLELLLFGSLESSKIDETSGKHARMQAIEDAAPVLVRSYAAKQQAMMAAQNLNNGGNVNLSNSTGTNNSSGVSSLALGQPQPEVNFNNNQGTSDAGNKGQTHRTNDSTISNSQIDTRPDFKPDQVAICRYDYAGRNIFHTALLLPEPFIEHDGSVKSRTANNEQKSWKTMAKGIGSVNGPFGPSKVKVNYALTIVKSLSKFFLHRLIAAMYQKIQKTTYCYSSNRGDRHKLEAYVIKQMRRVQNRMLYELFFASSPPGSGRRALEIVLRKDEINTNLYTQCSLKKKTGIIQSGRCKIPHAGGRRAMTDYYHNIGTPLSQSLMAPPVSPIAFYLVDNPLLLRSRVDPEFPLSYWRAVVDQNMRVEDDYDREVGEIRKEVMRKRFDMHVIQAKKHIPVWVKEEEEKKRLEEEEKKKEEEIKEKEKEAKKKEKEGKEGKEKEKEGKEDSGHNKKQNETNAETPSATGPRTPGGILNTSGISTRGEPMSNQNNLKTKSPRFVGDGQQGPSGGQIAVPQQVVGATVVNLNLPKYNNEQNTPGTDRSINSGESLTQSQEQMSISKGLKQFLDSKPMTEQQQKAFKKQKDKKDGTGGGSGYSSDETEEVDEEEQQEERAEHFRMGLRERIAEMQQELLADELREKDTRGCSGCLLDMVAKIPELLQIKDIEERYFGGEGVKGSKIQVSQMVFNSEMIRDTLLKEQRAVYMHGVNSEGKSLLNEFLKRVLKFAQHERQEITAEFLELHGLEEHIQPHTVSFSLASWRKYGVKKHSPQNALSTNSHQITHSHHNSNKSHHGNRHSESHGLGSFSFAFSKELTHSQGRIDQAIGESMTLSSKLSNSTGNSIINLPALLLDREIFRFKTLMTMIDEVAVFEYCDPTTKRNILHEIVAAEDIETAQEILAFLAHDVPRVQPINLIRLLKQKSSPKDPLFRSHFDRIPMTPSQMARKRGARGDWFIKTLDIKHREIEVEAKKEYEEKIELLRNLYRQVKEMEKRRAEEKE